MNPDNNKMKPMIKIIGILIILIIIFVFVFFITNPTSDSKYNVEIIRDDRGIAHIYGKGDMDAFFGLGYATAEDRLFQMNKTRMIMKGRFAETVGSKTGNLNPIIEKDKKMRTLGYQEHMEKVYENLDSETKSVLDAYTQGVNHYIKTNQRNLMNLFDEFDIQPEPWTPVDSLLSWSYMVHSNPRVVGGLREFESFKNSLSEDKIPRGMTKEEYAVTLIAKPSIYDTEAAVIKEEDLSSSYIKAINDYANKNPVFGAEILPYKGAHTDIRIINSINRKMSHGWVVSGEKSTTGNTLMLGQPIIPTFNPNFWYEYHIIGKTFDMRGIGMPGAPTFFIGFNKDVAFTQTSISGIQTDAIKLKMVGNQYEVDGVLYDFETRNEEIKVKDGNSEFITIKSTLFGPVITNFVDSLRGEEYVHRAIPLWGNEHTVQATLPMMRAKNVSELMKAIKYFRYPSLNTVIGDSNGNIGYMISGAFPLRSSNNPIPGIIEIDGSSVQNDWQGIIPSDLMPQVINPSSGVLFSANHLPFGYWYPINIVHTSKGDFDRSWRIRELLEGPLAPKLFSPEYVLNMHYDKVNLPSTVIAKAGLRLKNSRISQNVKSALVYLESWLNSGGEHISSSKYQVLADFPNDVAGADKILADYGGFSQFYKNLAKRLDENPDPNDSSFLRDYEIEFIEGTINSAWIKTNNVYGNDPEMWQERFKATDGILKVIYQDSREEDFGSLKTSLDKEHSLEVVHLSTLFSQIDQPYVQFVDFANLNNSKTISPPGISENPESPFYNNQETNWLEGGKLYPAPLARDLIENTKTSIKKLEVVKE